MKTSFKLYLEDILGLQAIDETGNERLQSVMQLLLDIRREAKTKKTSPHRIRYATN